ncbi:hypothetical protein BH11BAC4_BH11BAC4_11630 [soil metagenome]
MLKYIPYKISRQATFLALYLFAFLFLALYGRQGFQTLNQVILWAFGPALAFYVLEPNFGKLHKIPREYFFYVSLVLFAFFGFQNVQDESGFFRYLQVFIANFVLMIVVFFAINNIKEWVLAWKVIGLVGLIVAIVGYFIEAPSVQTDEYFRLSGITGNANGTANYARVGVVAALIIMQLTTQKYWRAALWAVIGFLGYTILLTASRGNFANLVFIVGGYFTFKYFNGWRLVFLLFLLFVFGNLILFLGEQFLSGFYLFERLTRNDSVSSALDDESRLQLYAIAWKYFLDYPLFGVGLNQFHIFSEGKITHTDILDILVQLGIFAGVIYVSIYVSVFRRILKLRNYFNNSKDLRMYQIILLCFISEILFGFSNPNWFTQLQMVVLSLVIVYVTKIGNTSEGVVKK